MPSGKVKSIHDGQTTRGRYSKRLRLDLAKRIAEFDDLSDTTEEEEAKVRWMMEEYLVSYSNGDITIDQLYPNWLVGLKTLSEAIERRVKAQYMKQRLVTPEQMMIIFRLIGDVLEVRISDQREKQLVAMDIAALIAGQSGIIRHTPYKHLELPETNAVKIIDNAICERPVGDGRSAHARKSEDAAGRDAIEYVVGDARELSPALGAATTD